MSERIDHAVFDIGKVLRHYDLNDSFQPRRVAPASAAMILVNASKVSPTGDARRCSV